MQILMNYFYTKQNSKYHSINNKHHTISLSTLNKYGYMSWKQGHTYLRSLGNACEGLCPIVPGTMGHNGTYAMKCVPLWTKFQLFGDSLYVFSCLNNHNQLFLLNNINKY